MPAKGDMQLEWKMYLWAANSLMGPSCCSRLSLSCSTRLAVGPPMSASRCEPALARHEAGAPEGKDLDIKSCARHEAGAPEGEDLDISQGSPVQACCLLPNTPCKELDWRGIWVSYNLCLSHSCTGSCMIVHQTNMSRTCVHQVMERLHVCQG